MPQRSQYAGRHRGRHRAPATRSPRGGLALPGAAAAALTLTATGAAVMPALNAGSASATGANPTPNPKGRTANAAGTKDAQHIDSARAEVRRAELETIANQARERAQARASRAAERKRIEERKAKALKAAHRWVLPVAHYRFSSPFGYRWGRLHAGDDFAAPIGTRIRAISSGTVIFAGQESGYGNKVEVRHWDGTVSWYAHMSHISVKVGDDLAPGDKVGEIGNTGHSTGPHLHLEIHPGGGAAVDPQAWFAKHHLKV